MATRSDCLNQEHVRLAGDVDGFVVAVVAVVAIVVVVVVVVL